MKSVDFTRKGLQPPASHSLAFAHLSAEKNFFRKRGFRKKRFEFFAPEVQTPAEGWRQSRRGAAGNRNREGGGGLEMVLAARVAVSAAAYAFDKPYDYLIPDSLTEKVRVGVRAAVPFGRGNKSAEAVVLSVQEVERVRGLKSISAVLDDSPVLDQEGLRLAFWLRERYFCTVYEAVKTILPAGLWYCLRETCHIVGAVTEEELTVLLGEQGRKRTLYDAILARGGQAETDTLRSDLGDWTAQAIRELSALGLITVETTASRKIRDKTVKRISLAVPAEEALAAVTPKKSRAPLRYEVIRLLCAAGSAVSTDLCYFTGASTATLRSLEKSGLIVMEPEETYRVPLVAKSGEAGPIALNDEQQAAFEGILELSRSGTASCSLLFGVTGSGKTEVYIRLLQEIVADGKTGMILVPEIALTPQMMERFSVYFGDQVAMLHSSLRLSERYDQWKRIQRGEVQVVLGTRSAVFAPLKNLGMIILDEEQENSYQSENPPRYHARDVAKYRCSESGAALLLGSATPTVESSYYARTGRYHQFFLRYRYNARPLPQVVLADLRQEVRAGNSGIISAPLKKALEETIARGEQSILFLNRRGSSRMLLCGACGAAPQCPRCSVPLTYHSANDRLMCHYCGHSQPAQELCGECGGRMKHVGFGTQRVEEELHTLFPEAAILRMDADTAAAGHEKLLSQFVKEKIPILLGTQMVAKGLDFENVTLVGVLAADLSLYVDSFRAAERTFSLLTQVVGRAGRGGKTGRAVIQTYTPDNDVIVSAARQDYEAFYASEIRMRRIRREPPFADLFTLTVSGLEEGAVLRAALSLRDALRQAIGTRGASRLPVELLGPAPAPILKLNNRYRYRLLWVGKNDHQIRELLSHYLNAFHAQKENRALHLFIDCNGLD